MTNSIIVPLVRYISLFNKVWHLTEEEAQAKLKEESEYYERWKGEPYADFIYEPRIVRAPYNEAA